MALILAGYVTRICEIYIDDLLELLDNLRKTLVRLRTNRVTANPETQDKKLSMITNGSSLRLKSTATVDDLH